MSTAELPTKKKPEPKVKLDYRKLVKLGDSIMIGKFPGDRELIPGQVSVIGDNGIKAVGILPGARMSWDCLYHVNDPECESRPGMFKEDDTGVFDLSPAEYDRRAIARKQVEQDEILIDLTLRIAALESKPKPTKKPVASKPRHVSCWIS